MRDDPIAYLLNRSNIVQGYMNTGIGENASIAKIQANKNDATTKKVLVNNVAERGNDGVFGINSTSSAYALDEPLIGDFHKSYAGEILSNTALKDVMTVAPDEYELGGIEFS
jgi:hypothetical protein